MARLVAGTVLEGAAGYGVLRLPRSMVRVGPAEWLGRRGQDVPGGRREVRCGMDVRQQVGVLCSRLGAVLQYGLFEDRVALGRELRAVRTQITRVIVALEEEPAKEGGAGETSADTEC